MGFNELNFCAKYSNGTSRISDIDTVNRSIRCFRQIR